MPDLAVLGTILLRHMEARRGEMLGALRVLVEHESPSRDKPALDALADRLTARFERFGGVVERRANPEGGDHLLIRFESDESKPPGASPGDSVQAHRPDAPLLTPPLTKGGPGGVGPGPALTAGPDTPFIPPLARGEVGKQTSRHATVSPALVMAHFDTVWPAGTLARMPFRIDGDRVRGPGVYDMKASLILAEFAVRALIELRQTPPRPLVLLLTSDEEIGSPTSRGLIEETARGAAYVLVPEPPTAAGALKTARKGVGRFRLAVTGRAAHAGVEPEKGVNAIVELARQILNVQGLADPGLGTSVNVGLVTGGTTPNVVPASALAEVDVRVTTAAEARRIETAMAALSAATTGAALCVSGGFNRPPMERTPGVAALFERARVIGAALGMDLREGSTGGASDGNFTAALGVPTLDGLGTNGGGAHADDEHILIDDLSRRAALLAMLLLGL